MLRVLSCAAGEEGGRAVARAGEEEGAGWHRPGDCWWAAGHGVLLRGGVGADLAGDEREVLLWLGSWPGEMARCLAGHGWVRVWGLPAAKGAPPEGLWWLGLGMMRSSANGGWTTGRDGLVGACSVRARP